MKTGGKLALIAGTATFLLVLSGCAGGSEPAATTSSSSTDRTEAQQTALDSAFTGVGQDLASLPRLR